MQNGIIFSENNDSVSIITGHRRAEVLLELYGEFFATDVVSGNNFRITRENGELVATTTPQNDCGDDNG